MKTDLTIYVAINPDGIVITDDVNIKVNSKKAKDCINADGIINIDVKGNKTYSLLDLATDFKVIKDYIGRLVCDTNLNIKIEKYITNNSKA